jgi:hypothetical protein
MQVLEYLVLHQRCVEHLQTSLGILWDRHPPRDVNPPFGNIRALDFYVTASHKLYLVTLTLLKRSSKLRRIAIGETKDAVRAFEEQFTNSNWLKSLPFPELEELSLYGLSFKKTEDLSPWNQVMILPTLKRLTVWGCEGLDDLIFRITKSMSKDALNLQHLAIGIDYDGASLLVLLDACKSLTSLHVCTTFPPDFAEFSQSIEKHGPSLRTLGLHEYGAPPDCSLSIRDEFDMLCRICCKVRYLGVQLDLIDLDVDNWDLPSGCPKSIATLGHMEELRLIHFRLPPTGSTQTEDVNAKKNQAYIAWAMRRFCTAVFEHIC